MIHLAAQVDLECQGKTNSKNLHVEVRKYLQYAGFFWPPENLDAVGLCRWNDSFMFVIYFTLLQNMIFINFLLTMLIKICDIILRTEHT